MSRTRRLEIVMRNGKAFILSKKFLSHSNNECIKAFTLAEVLITLGIIGIVAALTMPTLIAEHKRQTNVARVKKLFSIMAQSVEISKAEYGDISSWDWNLNTQNFVETYFLKNFSITKNCKTASGCWNTNGIIYGLNNTYKEQIKTNSFYKVQLADGTYLAIIKQDNKHIHIYSDVNGDKGPDKYGIDCYVLTMTSGAFNDGFQDIANAGIYFYGHGLPRNTLLNGNTHGCNKKQSGANCGALYQMDGWKVQPDYKF